VHLPTVWVYIQQAIDSAQESFPELKDVNRDLICLEVRVSLNQTERKMARIGRTAWPVVLSTLVRFEIVHIRVASPPHAIAVALPPPYASEGSWDADNKAKGPQPDAVSPTPQSSHSHPQSLTTRVVELFSSKSPRGSQSSQPHYSQNF
jgi:hypothetical protein